MIYTKYPKKSEKHHKIFIYGMMDDLVEYGLDAAYARAVAGSVSELMSNDALHYHNYIHPLAMMEFAQNNGVELTAWEKIAVWFHDSIYEPMQPENERRSADLFENLIGLHSGADLNPYWAIIETSKHLDRIINPKFNRLMDLDLHSFAPLMKTSHIVRP